MEPHSTTHYTLYSQQTKSNFVPFVATTILHCRTSLAGYAEKAIEFTIKLLIGLHESRSSRGPIGASGKAAAIKKDRTGVPT